MAAGDTTDGEGGYGRGSGGKGERLQNGGECERADSADDSIEKRAMGEREGGRRGGMDERARGRWVWF